MIGQAPPTPPTPIQAPALGSDLASLQAQLLDLHAQLASLEAQHSGLREQLDQMLRSNPARPGVQQTWADVGVQMAHVRGQIVLVEARIAAIQGRPYPASTPPPVPRGFNPNMMVPAVTVVTLVMLFPVSLAWARRILRGAPKPAPVPSDLTMRLERMEQAIDTIAIEVERVSEGQRFVTKVLVDRPAQSAAASSEDSAMPQAKPQALGPGPMEPIVVSERERVRQRIITPH